MSIVINGMDMPKGNSVKNLLIYSDGGVFTGHKDDANYFAEELPERMGKWISLDDFRGKYNENGYKCSECGEYSDYKENYCPNCGAKMEGD